MAIKDVQKAFKKDGLKGVWRWAVDGAYTRWRTARKWAGKNLSEARRRFKAAKDRFQHANAAIKTHKAKAKELEKRERTLEAKLKAALGTPQEDALRAQLVEVRGDRARVRREITQLRKDRNRTLDTKRHFADRVQNWVRVHVIYRRKWKKARKRHQEQEQEQPGSSQPSFEPWMANGKNYWDANQWAKDFVARAVVIDGNYCTSMARTYVPPGGSSTSYHLVWNGGKAADVGPMSTTQVREFNRGKGSGQYYELFGPINSQWLKFGSVISGAEGSALEQLHDTHTHGAGSY
jgi:hypothetical protein